MKIAITGGTGLIGKALSQQLLADHHRLLILSRNPQKGNQSRPVETVPWDAVAGVPPAQDLDGADAVIHLVGASIAGGLWTESRKQLLWDSRVKGTQHLVEALSHCRQRPRVLISSSAVGYYGDGGQEVLTEDSPPGDLFLSDLAQEWESASLQAKSLGMRVVLLRNGLVLARSGGLLHTLLRPFKLGLGGKVGDGSQWMSWIHLEDQLRVIRYVLDNASMEGPVNVASPAPVTNQEFTRTLARVLHRPALVPQPAFAIRFLMGQMGRELLLAGQRVSPAKLLAGGFSFHYTNLEAALRDLLQDR